MDWQPIASAPTYRPVIVTDGLNVGPGEFIVSEECWIGCGGMTPTHWMDFADVLALHPLPHKEPER